MNRNLCKFQCLGRGKIIQMKISSMYLELAATMWMTAECKCCNSEACGPFVGIGMALRYLHTKKTRAVIVYKNPIRDNQSSTNPREWHFHQLSIDSSLRLQRFPCATKHIRGVSRPWRRPVKGSSYVSCLIVLIPWTSGRRWNRETTSIDILNLVSLKSRLILNYIEGDTTREYSH